MLAEAHRNVGSRLVQLDPERKTIRFLQPGVRLNLAMALHSAGRYGESVAQLERLRASQARNSRFWFLSAVRSARTIPAASSGTCESG